MKMNNTNGRAWIGIIISIILASGGISFGAIQQVRMADVKNTVSRLVVLESNVHQLNIQTEVIKNELFHINKKLDQILNK